MTKPGIYTNNTFHGYWPVGASAAVVALGPEQAADLLNAHLAEHGPKQPTPVEPSDMKLMPLHLGDVRILNDGEY